MLDKLVRGLERGTPPPAKAETGFFTDTTVCIGCKACEVACKQWNQLPADGFEWTGNSHDNTGALSATSWRHVKFIEQFPEGSPGRWLMMSDVCKHCVDAPCHEACPTGAIVYNETGNVYIQQDVCNGCAYCVAACPFGVITRGAFDGHAHKCTLCYDRQRDGMTPACAKACPTASIQFGTMTELRERAQARVETLHARGVESAYLYGNEETDTYSQLNSFYLLIDKPAIYGLPDKPVHPWVNMRGDYLRAASSGLVALLVVLLVFVTSNP
jgi:formate dehydrogenase iron-sulfur subunit